MIEVFGLRIRASGPICLQETIRSRPTKDSGSIPIHAQVPEILNILNWPKVMWSEIVLLRARLIQKFECLQGSLADRAFRFISHELAVDYKSLRTLCMRPCDEQAGPATAQPVFPVDVSATLEYSLEVRPGRQLGRGLLVVEPL